MKMPMPARIRMNLRRIIKEEEKKIHHRDTEAQRRKIKSKSKITSIITSMSTR